MEHSSLQAAVLVDPPPTSLPQLPSTPSTPATTTTKEDEGIDTVADLISGWLGGAGASSRALLHFLSLPLRGPSSSEMRTSEGLARWQEEAEGKGQAREPCTVEQAGAGSMFTPFVAVRGARRTSTLGVRRRAGRAGRSDTTIWTEIGNKRCGGRPTALSTPIAVSAFLLFPLQHPSAHLSNQHSLSPLLHSRCSRR
jgi:hypothetical protein